jgi:hypothetical protein
MASEHWLFRLSAEDWLAAAGHELELAANSERSRRKLLTHLRRGAGMALNAVLVAAHAAGELDESGAETIWGRSYIDHLRRLADHAASGAPSTAQGGAIEVSDALRAAARTLVTLRLTDPQQLVRLKSGPPAELIAATAQASIMLEWAKAYTGARASDLATL